MPVTDSAQHNEVETTPRRRSILPRTSTPYVANDDEVERLKRRTNSELQKKVSGLGVANLSSFISDSEAVELNESKLQDHYQTCVKLFTENKINSKNAWNVHILEYMQAMLKKGFVMKDTLKLASTSIDIGCKVYCLKVDQVHNDLFKLASAMARIDVEDNGRDNGGNDVEDAEDVAVNEDVEANKKKEKKKKRVRKSYENQDTELTVATNENTLNGVITPHNTAIQDISSGKSRLYTLSTITKQNWGFEQMVNRRSQFPYFTALESSEDNISISDEKVSVTIPHVNAQICPSFTDFVIDRWQPDDDDVPIGTQPFSNISQNNLVYDDNGLPIPELDASVQEPDDRDNVFDDPEEIMETGVGHTDIRRPVAFITEMRPGQGPLSNVPLQYSYRSAPVVSERYMLSGVWAGPSHWKIKSLQRRSAHSMAESVNVAPHRGKRGAKKPDPEIVRFGLESDVEEEAIAPAKNQKKSKRVRRGSLSRLTLPEDLGIVADDLYRLKNRSEIRIHIGNVTEENNAHTSRVNLNMTANYQYDNPDDANYCSQTVNDNADDDGDDQNECHNTDLNGDVLQHTLTDEMVNIPSQVQKFHVPYATQAKRMDMKKLKEAIWKTMVLSQNDDEEILNDNERLHNVKLEQVQFSKIYKKLPTHITSRMAEDMSFPLAFVALLHLANEETLHLTGTPELNDIIINNEK